MARGLAFAIALGAATSACRTAPATAVDAPLAAELAGCAAVIAQPSDAGGARPACALGPERDVRVLVPGAGGHVEARAGDAAVELRPWARPVAGADLFVLRVPEGASTITVTRVDASGARASRTFVFAPSPRPPWFAGAQALRQEGKLDEAEAAARAALGAADAAERAAAEGILARVALRRGKIDEAVAHFRGAIALDTRAGLVSDRADDAFALAFVLHKRARRYGEARSVLDEVALALDDYPEGRAREPLYRAQVAWEAGDTRTAARLLATAIERATRIGAASIARAARQVRAMVACSAGSTRACVAALREADRELEGAGDAPACERAEVVISLGFAELEHAEVTGAFDPARLGEADERGLRLLAACPDPYMRAVALEHLAMAAVFAGDARRARARLDEARAIVSEPRTSDAVMGLEIEARIAELERAPRAALASFDAARALARGSALRDQERRAVLGRARVLEAAGRLDEALAAYREAEDLLDELVRAIPLGEGRAGAALDGGESTRRAAAILVRRGRAGDALDLVRRARARLVRSLATSARVAALDDAARARWERAVAEYRDARAAVDADAEGDWKRARPALEAALAERAVKLAALRARIDDAMLLVAGDGSAPSLPALPDSDTVLAFARLGADRGITAFVRERARTRAFSVPSLASDTPVEALADALLAPASAEIARAGRLRLLVEDGLAWIDVHALPWRGRPLVAHAPVVYATDLEPAPAPSRDGVALVIADPTGDLPAARAEGAAVLAALAGSRATRSLVGREASAPRVREALSSASLLHYAGHAVFRGREGAESALPLAQGGALTLGDVLTLPRAPSSIVLSGCEAGRAHGEGEEGAAGLAQAFLLAGASVVVAPVRAVDDRAAASLAGAIHGAGDAGIASDLAEALARAQARAAAEGRPGWEAFRAFVR